MRLHLTCVNSVVLALTIFGSCRLSVNAQGIAYPSLAAPSNTIGVVLPLSGKYRQYGERARAAIELALAGTANNNGPSVVFRDGEGTEEASAMAVEQLVMNDRVIAIIGPLFSKEAQAASKRAEALGVPIISLSHQSGITDIGPHVLRTGLTVEAQAKALARVAFEKLGMRTFAILQPRNPYGISFANAFWNEVEKRKGEIRGHEVYEREQTTFKEPIRKLVGRWHLQARPAYNKAVREIEEQKIPAHRKQLLLQDLEKSFPPEIDFDGLIIPDSGQNLGLIAPALAFEDIVLTHDPKALEKLRKSSGQENLKPITLLGASTWNSVQTVNSCERYCENAVFVDAFFADSASPKVRAFVAAFEEKTHSAPQLSDAIAYDTALLVKSHLTTSQPSKREDLLKLLRNGAPFDGITGRLRFLPNGDIERDLVVLTITNKQIVPWKLQ